MSFGLQNVNCATYSMCRAKLACMIQHRRPPPPPDRTAAPGTGLFEAIDWRATCACEVKNEQKKKVWKV